ncbi:LamB/YcsF family protein [Brachybacterium paraconglomeratum]|uniref:LamB/YcsF family protein n=1 Tax=Brachybacterium paraconglomeratum TaxID=173362 RepID=UPI001FA40789|nr:5-oxoprolinase subunit PxpA [Candidatus Brachybacterium merdigallinarum]
MTRHIDLVADLGEGFGSWSMGDDSALLDVVSSANIACGFHAGDPRIMDRTVAGCVSRGVNIGAHPSFPDLVGFGRRTVEASAEEVRTDVIYQLGALQAFAHAHGGRVAHLAPHGRLGNLVAVRDDYARAVVDAISQVDPDLIVFAQDGELASQAASAGLPVAIVGIADRAYRSDGALVPRTEPGAVITDGAEIARRAIRIVEDGVVETVDGGTIPIVADTLLLHGDSTEAVNVSQTVRARLEDAGITITPLDADRLRS